MKFWILILAILAGGCSVAAYQIEACQKACRGRMLSCTNMACTCGVSSDAADGGAQ